MSTQTIACGNCFQHVAATVVHSNGSTVWLECPSCRDGSVRTADGVLYPTTPAGSAVTGLPADVEAAWQEVRRVQAVGAYTAAEIMCRKILMHLAVDLLDSKPGEPFARYIDDLEAAHYIAPHLKPVVDKVRTRGNAANHELAASTEQDCLTTMGITEHLLRTAYELPNL